MALNSIQIPVTLSVLLMPMNSLLMPAAIGGQYLLDILVIFIQVLLLITYLSMNSTNYRLIVPVGLIVMFSIVMELFFQPASLDNSEFETISISAVQTNIHPLTTLSLSGDGNIESLHKKRLDILHLIANNDQKTDLVIWPEVNFAKFEFRNTHNIAELAKQYKLNMLVPSPDMSPSGQSFSSIFSVSSEGIILGRQSKKLLIPIIEDSVYRDTSWEPHLFLPGKPGTIVCFESAFSLPSAMLASKGAGFISIATNESYAGPSILPLIHFELARLRAIETGKTVVRAANGGPSAIINKHGIVTNKLPLFTEGIISRKIAINYNNTFFIDHFDTITTLYKTLAITSFIILLVLFVSRRNFKLNFNINIKTIGYSTATIILLVFTQYNFIKNSYTTATNKIIPSGFINFQNGFIAQDNNYSSMKASNAHQSLISSITFLLRDYGNNLGTNDISTYFKTDSDSQTNIKKINNIAGQYDYYVKNNNYQPQGNPVVATPCLALLENGETVVILEFTDSHTTIFSPYNMAELTLKTDSFIKRWTGQTLQLLPDRKHWDL
ncbi:MAG: hypothetical protein GXP13_09900 [Gammaproteobacteria bacterium]|nr:hypothetical protein [Gammaproteobacteria bacterium]